MNDVRTRTVVR